MPRLPSCTRVRPPSYCASFASGGDVDWQSDLAEYVADGTLEGPILAIPEIERTRPPRADITSIS